MSPLPTNQLQLVQPGDTAHRLIRLNEQEITAFAKSGGDKNPLPFHVGASEMRPSTKKVISGAQTTSLLMGLASNYFSRDDDGVSRQAVPLNFNFSFKGPMYADEDVTLRWTVNHREWSTKLDGWVVHADGVASTAKMGVTIVGRATLLIKGFEVEAV
jgi:acyl dehydratase